MGRDARIVLDVDGLDVEFRLALGGLIALQEACSAGPFVILARLAASAAGTEGEDDIAATLALGMVGAGERHAAAFAQARRWSTGRTRAENALLAYTVLRQALIGPEDEPVGTKAAGVADARQSESPNGMIRFASIYGAGAVMGFTPQQIDAMSMWQFMAAVEGYADAHERSTGSGLSAEEKDDLAAWIGI